MDISEPANFGDYRPEDICYPHFDLNKRRNAYEEKISSLIPLKIIRRHEAMKKLYQKIKAVEKDEEKWIETMFESGDIEFVEHNIEYRIGKDLTNKKLWKLYIQFLKKYDKKVKF
uniref:Uncharacterized protein n=1 Tax=Panagrolaimus superbus TaxID=310955 RepID=A0A914Y827_9BILA